MNSEESVGLAVPAVGDKGEESDKGDPHVSGLETGWTIETGRSGLGERQGKDLVGLRCL